MNIVISKKYILVQMAKLQLHIVTWLVGPVKCYNFLERKKFYKLRMLFYN